MEVIGRKGAFFLHILEADLNIGLLTSENYLTKIHFDSDTNQPTNNYKNYWYLN